MELSAYEKQRAANIHRNRQCLVDLGIDAPLIVKTVPIKPAPSARKRKVEDEAYTLPSRRASARTVERETTKEKAAKASDDDDDDDDDEDYEDLEDVVREKPKKKRFAQTKEAPVPGLAAITSCIIVEAAKTSRSKCRRCMEILAAGSLRVGMESWMVGRQVYTYHTCIYLVTHTQDTKTPHSNQNHKNKKNRKHSSNHALSVSVCVSCVCAPSPPHTCTRSAQA